MSTEKGHLAAANGQAGNEVSTLFTVNNIETNKYLSQKGDLAYRYYLKLVPICIKLVLCVCVLFFEGCRGIGVKVENLLKSFFLDFIPLYSSSSSSSSSSLAYNIYLKLVALATNLVTLATNFTFYILGININIW